MSRNRTLSDKFAWTEKLRAIELLDWETRPEDFDQLCVFILQLFAERDAVSRDRLFRILPEAEFRRQLRVCAESFKERHVSLAWSTYLRMKPFVVPKAARRKKDRGNGDVV